MTAPTRERDIVRRLAEKVAALACEPRMDAIRKRWRDVNALRKPDRAPVWCRPVGCWREILPSSSLECTEPGLRHLEYNFRQILYKRDIDDDTPVEPFLTVPGIFRVQPSNTWGVDIRRHASPIEGGAWAYDPPLKQSADFDLLTIPRFVFDRTASARRVEEFGALLAGIMPAKLEICIPLGATLGTAAADLRGLEQMMLDMSAEPALMHRLMAFLRDATLGAIDQAEATGLLSPNNGGAMTCSDPIGTISSGAPLSARNLWCAANSQEFDQVSPAMWEEFCLDYQKPIFERFGLVEYGCCENLTHKIDGVLGIPNLRIFVCSAWTDLDRVIEKVGRKHCIMWRQKASDVVFPAEAAPIRKALSEGAKRLRGSYYQVVLRELETLAGHPDRLRVWTRCAKEAAEQFA